MNDKDCNDTAKKFVDALAKKPDVCKQWVAIYESGDWSPLCALIAQATGLAQVPTSQDLDKMRAHGAGYLQAELTALAKQGLDAGYTFNGAGHPGH
jgi:hypothetical protein